MNIKQAINFLNIIYQDFPDHELKFDAALKAIEELQAELDKTCVNFEEYADDKKAEIKELRKLLIECANFIDPHNQGDGEAERLINIIDELP